MAVKKSTGTALSKDAAKAKLEKLLSDAGAIDRDTLNALLAGQGLKVVAKGISEAKYSRVEKRRAWMSATELSEEEHQLVKSLPEKIGQAPIIDAEKPRALTQDEIDVWMDETLVERPVEDVLEGRKQARRATMFNMASFLNGGDPFATATFYSPKHGYKFVVTKQERGGAADYSALKEAVGPEVWDAITSAVVTRTVDEDKLIAALAEGIVTMEQFQAVVPEKQVSRVLRVDPIKDGETIQ